jgi:hypothetical protein
MNIVLVSIGNFQEYILSNIRQLLRLGHTSIYVIVNPEFIPYFNEFNEHVKCISVTSLRDEFNYYGYQHPACNWHFRNGFNLHTSSRFFYLYAFIKQYNIQDVLHLENDVLVFHNSTLLKDKVDSEHIYVPIDCPNRAIASVVYIPRPDLLGEILSQYDVGRNDMENFSMLVRQFPTIFRTFPIGSTSMAHTEEERLVTQNWEKFHIVFDAAAIGQYLGGVDPRNIPGDTTGFVNETCVIKYNQHEFSWMETDGIRRPYVIHEGVVMPIFNLHIHSKNLDKFM